MVTFADDSSPTTQTPATNQDAPLAAWREKLRSLVFPKAHRQILKERDPEFQTLTKLPDWFEWLSLVMIVINMIALALTDPWDKESKSPRSRVLDIIDSVLTLFFLVELILRWVAMGRRRFVSDGWNLADSVIVFVSLVSLVLKFANQEFGSFTVLRSLRVLRPLRSITKFPQARLVVNAMLSGMRNLVDVSVLYLLFILSFGGAGVAQFSARFRTRCVNSDFDLMQNFTSGLNTIIASNFSSTSSTSAFSFANLSDVVLLVPADFVNNTNSSSSSYSTLTSAIVEHTPQWWFAAAAPTTSSSSVFVPTFPDEWLKSFAAEHVPAAAVALAASVAYRNFADAEPKLALGSIADFVCHGVYDNLIGHAGKLGCHEQQTCTEGNAMLFHGYRCPFGYSCQEVQNPYYGYVGFDNMLMAALTIQVMVTLELWFEVMYFAMDSTEFSAAIFCVLIIVIGNFFILNLITALIAVGFEKSHQAQVESLKRVAAMRRRIRSRGFIKFLGEKVGAMKSRARSRSLAERESAQQQRTRGASGGLETPMVIMRTPQSSQIGFNDDDSPMTDFGSPMGTPAPTSTSSSSSPIVALRVWMSAKVVDTLWFNVLSAGVILISILLMMTEYHGMPKKVEEIYEVFNVIFAVFVTVEMLLRFVATTPILFILDVGNVLGVVVVAVQWVDFAMDDFRLPAIRCLRIVVAARFIEKFPSIYRWFVVIFRAFKASMLLIVIIMLDIFIFACLGMQLFGTRFCGLDPETGITNRHCSGIPRANFDSFGFAVITSFTLVIGDDWNIVMMDAMRAVNPGIAVLFVLHLFISIYILVNLFVGILLSTAESVAEIREGDDEKKSQEEQQQHLSSNPSAEMAPSVSAGRQENQEDAGEEEEEEEEEEEIRGTLAKVRHTTKVVVNSAPVQTFIFLVILLSTVSLAMQSPIAAPDTKMSVILYWIDISCTAIFILECFVQVFALGLYKGPNAYLKSKWNVFDLFLVVCGVVDIVLSSFQTTKVVEMTRALYALRPLRFMKRSPGIQVVVGSLVSALPEIKDVVVVAVSVWALFGVGGVQLFRGEFYRCSDPTITLEANCTAAGYEWVNAPLHFDNIGAAMLSLFVVSTFEGWTPILYDSIDAVQPGVAPRLNYNPKASIYVICFAVVGGFFLVNMFISVLIGTYEKQKKSLQKNKVFLTAEQSAWLRSNHKILTSVPLAEYALREEVREEREEENDNSAGGGVSTDSFYSFSQQQMLQVPQPTATPLTTGRQRRQGGTDRRQPNNNNMSLLLRIKKRAFVFTTHSNFNIFIYICIVLNFVIMAMDHYPIQPGFESFLNVANMVFIAIFTLEAIVKILALSPKFYFSSRWNGFDFFVVAVSIIGLVAELLINKKSFGSILRTLRIVRLARLVKGAKSVHQLIKKFMTALYTLSNVAALLVLFFSIVAIACMKVLGRNKWDHEVITHHANFQTFANGFLLLLRISTGGSWPDVMQAMRVQPPSCLERIGECGHSYFVPIVFVVFFIVGAYVLLNVFVAVIMDSFSSEDEDDDLGGFISDEETKQFVEAWMRFDWRRRMRIASCELVPLLNSLPSGHPFSIPKSSGVGSAGKVAGRDMSRRTRRRLDELRFLFRLDFCDYNNEIEFLPTIVALAKLCRNVTMDMRLLEPLQNAYNRRFRSAIESGEDRAIKVVSDPFQRSQPTHTSYNLAHRFAVQIFVESWRSHKEAAEKRDEGERSVKEAAKKNSFDKQGRGGGTAGAMSSSSPSLLRSQEGQATQHPPSSATPPSTSSSSPFAQHRVALSPNQLPLLHTSLTNGNNNNNNNTVEPIIARNVHGSEFREAALGLARYRYEREVWERQQQQRRQEDTRRGFHLFSVPDQSVVTSRQDEQQQDRNGDVNGVVDLAADDDIWPTRHHHRQQQQQTQTRNTATDDDDEMDFIDLATRRNRNRQRPSSGNMNNNEKTRQQRVQEPKGGNGDDDDMMDFL